MKKYLIASLLVTCAWWFAAATLSAQIELQWPSFQKTFRTKAHYLDLPSWNTLGQPDTYIPLFVEYYYEVTDAAVVEYAFWYSDSNNKYTSKTAKNATYDVRILSSVFVTKIPLSAFDRAYWADWELKAEYEDNARKKELFADDKGASAMMTVYATPYYEVNYKIKQGQSYEVTTHRKAEKMPEIETREGSEYSLRAFNFSDEYEANAFVAKLKNALDKRK